MSPVVRRCWKCGAEVRPWRCFHCDQPGHVSDMLIELACHYCHRHGGKSTVTPDRPELAEEFDSPEEAIERLRDVESLEDRADSTEDP